MSELRAGPFRAAGSGGAAGPFAVAASDRGRTGLVNPYLGLVRTPFQNSVLLAFGFSQLKATGSLPR